jgi:hypothetical protein
MYGPAVRSKKISTSIDCKLAHAEASGDNAKLFAAEWADKLLAKADLREDCSTHCGFAGT